MKTFKNLDVLVNKLHSSSKIKNSIRNASLTALIAAMGFAGYTNPAYTQTQKQDVEKNNYSFTKETNFDRIKKFFPFLRTDVPVCLTIDIFGVGCLKSKNYKVSLPEDFRTVPVHKDDLHYISPDKAGPIEHGFTLNGDFLKDLPITSFDFGLGINIKNWICTGIGYGLSSTKLGDTEFRSYVGQSYSYCEIEHNYAGSVDVFRPYVYLEIPFFQTPIKRSKNILLSAGAEANLWTVDAVAGWYRWGAYEPFDKIRAGYINKLILYLKFSGLRKNYNDGKSINLFDLSLGTAIDNIKEMNNCKITPDRNYDWFLKVNLFNVGIPID